MEFNYELGGVHHVTAITSDAEKIYQFYTDVLGMRLVKKNVNQDDIRTFHLFFADDRGNAGTDMTFFDFKGIGQQERGTNEISRTSFRVPSDAALDYWVKRFAHYDIENSGIIELLGKKMIFFEDFDTQRYALVSDTGDSGVLPGEAWHKGPVPDEYAITGLGPAFLTVHELKYMSDLLTQLFQMRVVATDDGYTLFEMGPGGNGGSVIVNEDKESGQAWQGYGGVHHLAFRVKDRSELDAWEAFFNQNRFANSGFVDRFYFQSLYIQAYPNILFELATDGPGFIDDQEDYEVLGETLTLPPKYRGQEEYIRTQLKDFDTVRSTKDIPKEYFD